jgi:hypothetical protein
MQNHKEYFGKYVNEMINAYKILVRKGEEKRDCGISRCKWKDDTKIYVGGIESGNVDWIHLA